MKKLSEEDKHKLESYLVEVIKNEPEYMGTIVNAMTAGLRKHTKETNSRAVDLEIALHFSLVNNKTNKYKKVSSGVAKDIASKLKGWLHKNELRFPGWENFFEVNNLSTKLDKEEERNLNRYED